MTTPTAVPNATRTSGAAGTTPATITSVVASPATCAGKVNAKVDKAKLPIGDGNVSTTAKCGSFFSCQTSFNGGGASARGPWFNNDGKTWDLTKKGVVHGSVSWTSKLTVTVSGNDRSIAGNDLPKHATGVFPIGSGEAVAAYDRNPNSIAEQSVQFTVPANPTLLAQPACAGGEVGVLLTGAMLFSPLDAGGRDAVAWEAQDSCTGHPQNSGIYHYHSVSACVSDSASGHSSLVGYALDGFGIFGPRGEDGKELTDADLDECHGHTHTIEWDGKQVSMYHYHATTEYPYVVGCYRGTATRVVTGGQSKNPPPAP